MARYAETADTGRAGPPATAAPAIDFAGVRFGYPVRPGRCSTAWTCHPRRAVHRPGGGERRRQDHPGEAPRPACTSRRRHGHAPTASTSPTSARRTGSAGSPWCSRTSCATDLSAADNIGSARRAASTDRAGVRRRRRRPGCSTTLDALPNGLDTLLARGLRRRGGPVRRSVAAHRHRPRPVRRLPRRHRARPRRAHRAARRPRRSRVLRPVRRADPGPRRPSLISHRLSTVRLADRIVLLDQGRVVEQGSHDELMAAAVAGTPPCSPSRRNVSPPTTPTAARRPRW